MRISAYSFDLGPAKNLGMVVAAALARGHRVKFVGNDIYGNTEFLNPQPDVLLTGLSSFRKHIELGLGSDAVADGVCWVVVADTHNIWKGIPSQQVERAVLLVASPQEVAVAQACGWGRVEYLGGPPVWQEFFEKAAPPEPPLPLNTVLVGGVKDPAITNAMLQAVVTAGREMLDPSGWLLFVSHPNEEYSPDLLVERTAILQSVFRVPLPKNYSLTQVLDFVPLAVFTGGATDSIAAAYKRTPVIYYSSDAVRERLASQQGGDPEWFPASCGTLAVATDETMPEALTQLLQGYGVTNLRARQAEVYPRPASGQPRPEARVVGFLESLTQA